MPIKYLLPLFLFLNPLFAAEVPKVVIKPDIIFLTIPYLELEQANGQKQAYQVSLSAKTAKQPLQFGIDSLQAVALQNKQVEDWYHPPVSVRWQWQLLGKINSAYAVELYDIDLFNTDIAQIRALQAEGKKVICYFSAGSYEDFREDKPLFKPEELGRVLDGWDNEKWLDIRSDNVRTIMRQRLDLAQQKGCNGVEPDNMDGYINNSGFALTAADQLDFNRFIANEAHNRNLSVGLKNDLAQISELVDYFDFSVNEQCFEYQECELLKPFIENNKPVLNAEYLPRFQNDASARAELCQQAKDLRFSNLILALSLDDSLRWECLP